MFKKVAVSENTSSLFGCAFVLMIVGLIYSVTKMISNLQDVSITMYILVIVATYAFYRLALSPNGYLNTYLKFWWVFVNGGNDVEMKWYDKIMLVISATFTIIGMFVALILTIILFGFVLAVF